MRGVGASEHRGLSRPATSTSILGAESTHTHTHIPLPRAEDVQVQGVGALPQLLLPSSPPLPSLPPARALVPRGPQQGHFLHWRAHLGTRTGRTRHRGVWVFVFVRSTAPSLHGDPVVALRCPPRLFVPWPYSCALLYTRASARARALVCYRGLDCTREGAGLLQGEGGGRAAREAGEQRGRAGRWHRL